MHTLRIVLAASILAVSSMAFAAPKPAPATSKASQPTEDMVHVADCANGKQYWAPTNEHRGACSGAGGVIRWTDGSPVRSKGPKSNRYR